MPNSYPASQDEMSRFAAVVLEVSEFLEQRRDDVTTLSFKEEQIINEGLNYLELVKNGQETVQSSGASIVARDESLSAYEEASEALRWAQSAAADPTGKTELINTSLRVLSGLLSGRALNELDADAVKRTRNLFRTLEEYHFSGHSAQPVGIFGRSYDFED